MLDATTIIFGFLSMLLATTAYFLRQTMARISQIEGRQLTIELSMQEAKARIDATVAELQRLERKTDDHDKAIEAFYRDLPALIREAVRPMIESLHKDIERLYNAKR